VTDTTVKGTLTRGEAVVPIVDGKLVKNKLTFTATLGEQTETLTGDYAGDGLKVWLDRQGPEMAVVFKRAGK
jgi:hypothetical protein